MSLDRVFKRLFGDEEPTRLGTGWVSGVLSVVLGCLSLGAVLCFHFPELLTAPAFRSRYPVPLLRTVLQTAILLAFVFGALSGVLRRRKVLALTGLSLAVLSTLLGGASVPLPDEVQSDVGLGLDWFVLNLLVLMAIFVPMERAWPLHPDQLVFRRGWTTDGGHFLVSHLAVQLFAFASLVPITILTGWLFPSGGLVQRLGLPLWSQALLIVGVADFTQYWVHRAFHQLPWLWRIHAIHHSTETMDWLAGSRLHLLDALVTRSLSIAPVWLLGFSPAAVAIYLSFVSFHAVFIHANFGPSLRWMEHWLVTPRIHHFHHAREVEAIDKNFAVHLPFIDRLFGTRYLPENRWPLAYGIEDASVPQGWWGQFVSPFRFAGRPGSSRNMIRSGEP
jgi:sterol desaturase/sphingolipid hydroxylase (fatty acid hydroxylase superfamily)